MLNLVCAITSSTRICIYNNNNIIIIIIIVAY